MRHLLGVLGTGLLVLSGPPSAPAAERPPLSPWHLNLNLGTGGAAGGFGDVVEKPVALDMSIAKGRGPWRFGAGLEFGSLAMKPPYQGQNDWSRMSTYALGSRVFNVQGRARPYLQARLGLTRVHPRSLVFLVIPEEDYQAGHNPTKAANGFGLALVPGLEFQLFPSLALDLSAAFTAYKTGDLDLSAIGQTPKSSGNEWQLRGGLTWRPSGGGGAKGDPGGVFPSWGWATAEILGINFVSSTLNEYVRNESSYPITPRTIETNIEQGFKYDDNEFKTNQLIHPFNGATYFNSGRDNGLGFWGSSAMALIGAFMWECCGESQPMSWNDMVSTGLGGISRGEVSHRLAGLILDNTKRGKSRFWHELAAAPLDPIGQFNRLLSGRATRVEENRENPYDWRPPNLALLVSAGVRVIGEGSSISENTKTYGVLDVEVNYGSPFDNERRKPFDRFDGGVQLNYGEKTRIGRLQIRGDLWSKPLGGAEGEAPGSVLAVIQDFDYIDNEAYEYGGQGLGVGLFSRFGRGATRVTTRLAGYVVAGAAVNADYSFLAEIPDAREYRNYDYGPGAGGAFEMVVTRRGRPLGGLGYRYTYIDVKNGSLFDPAGAGKGSSATHQIHRGRVWFNAPVWRNLGVGGEAWLFYRDSDYSAAILKDHTQRNPEARAFLAWSWAQVSPARNR
jgi:uncharacterized protein DUF3943